MIRLLIIITMLPFFVKASDKDSAEIFYVLQNPKYFGIENARAWFEIAGLKNKKAEKKVNDTLKKIFNEKTLFIDDGDFGATLQNEKAPKGYKDYYFNNGHTYGEGYVRFKEIDSLLRLTEADGYFGAGMNLENFYVDIVQGKMFWLKINRSQGFTNSGDYFFSLVTGEIMPTSFKVLIAPEKKDSLSRLLYSRAIKMAKEEYPFKSFTVTDIPLSDTVTIYTISLLPWFHGKMNTLCIYQPYPYIAEHDFITSLPAAMNAHLNMDEALFFFTRDTKSKLEKIYEQ